MNWVGNQFFISIYKIFRASNILCIKLSRTDISQYCIVLRECQRAPSNKNPCDMYWRAFLQNLLGFSNQPRQIKYLYNEKLHCTLFQSKIWPSVIRILWKCITWNYNILCEQPTSRSSKKYFAINVIVKNECSTCLQPVSIKLFSWVNELICVCVTRLTLRSPTTRTVTLTDS